MEQCANGGFAHFLDQLSIQAHAVFGDDLDPEDFFHIVERDLVGEIVEQYGVIGLFLLILSLALSFALGPFFAELERFFGFGHAFHGFFFALRC